MRKILRSAATFLLSVMSVALVAQHNYVANQVIVLLHHDQSIMELVELTNQQHNAIGLKPQRTLSKRAGLFLLEFDSNQTSAPKVVEMLKEMPQVSLVQVNHNNLKQRNTVPNDQFLPLQWSLNTSSTTRIYAQEAWDYTTDGLTAHGDEIVMAVVDGGVDLSHNDLSLYKNVHEIPGNGIDDDNNGYVDDYDGWNAYFSNGQIGADPHGTHVAGIMAAKTNNNQGIAGIVWGGKILPISASSSIESVVLEGYGYALELRLTYNESNGDSGAFVVCTNSSFGVDFADSNDYPIWCAFYDTLGQAGIMNLGATTNVGVDVDLVGDVPTTCPSPHMIGVANVAQNGQLSGGWGETHVDLAAPGTNIYATIPPNSSYGYKSGTSMATPHVAGVIGAMFSTMCANELELYKQNPDSMALELRAILLDNVTPIPILDNKVVTGGTLNMLEAVKNTMVANCMESSAQLTNDLCATCDAEIVVAPQGNYPPFTTVVTDMDGTVVGDSIANKLCAGDYIIEITDRFGETLYDTVTLSANQALDITFTITPATDNSTPDGSITSNIAGGQPNYSYLWSNGETTQTINNLLPGVYTVTVTDDNNCEENNSVDLFTVGINPVSIQQTQVFPNPANAIITITSNEALIEQVDIYNVAGQLVVSKTVNALPEYQLGINLPDGLYTILINQSATHQVVVKN